MSKVTCSNQKPHGYKPAPNYVREWDDTGNGFLDTSDFAAYCLAVRDAIAELGNPCIAEIKRAIPNSDHRYLMDAIESLSSVGAIKCTRDIPPSRYALHTPPREPKRRQFNNQGELNLKKAPGPDSDSLYGDASIF